MKTKNNTTEQSEPPAVAGGLTNPTTQAAGVGEATDIQVQPPATAGGSDLNELRKENEQLKTTIRIGEAHRQITGELEKAGARSPGLLFDAVKGDLQFGDDGALDNAAALVGRLKITFPEQFGFDRPTASIDAGAGQAAVPRLTRETLARMKTAEIAALDWNDVRRVLAG